MCFISLNSNLGVKFLEEMKYCPKAAVLLEKRCLSTGPSTTGRGPTADVGKRHSGSGGGGEGSGEQL